SPRAGATDDKNNGDALCGHGLVGNRGLAGIAGALNLAFTLRVVRLLAFAVVFSTLASTFVFGEARFSGEKSARAHLTRFAGGLANVTALSAGTFHTCAVRADGTVWCWGDNGFEQLGVAEMGPRSTPVQVRFLSGAVVSVAAGGQHTCALLANGTVECWGDGS